MYVDWCSEKNETSISVKDFELSFNSKGFVAFEALMDKHQLANPTSYPIHGYSWEAFKTNQSRSERKRRDEHFAASVIAGYATQSTSLGTLLGGNLWAARLGKKLSNHKND